MNFPIPLEVSVSLLRNHEMTEKKLAALRRNQKLSHGPVTDEGRGRIRAACLRHGFYVQAEEVALRDLGEDPSQFQELLGGFWEEYDPVGASQESLVIRLARATWLMNRSDRMQEGCAVRQAHDVSSGREDRLHAQMMRLKMTEERLRRLAQSVATPHYVTAREDLEKMKSLHEDGVLRDMGEIALALFCQLQDPGERNEDGELVDSQEAQRKVLIRIKEIFGLHRDVPPPVCGAADSPPPEECPQVPSPVNSESDRRTPEVEDAGVAQAKQDRRYPHITWAEWEARERPRQLLENILTRQVEACESQRKALLKESLKGPSPYERAAEIAPTHPEGTHLRRMQDSYFREVRRVTNLLLKLKRHQRQMETFSSDYVADKKDS
jgi:hypothetical protein